MEPIPLGARCGSVLRRLTFPLCLGLSSTLASAQEAPRASFRTNPSIAHGEEILTVQFIDTSTGTISAWHWDLGDGTTSSEQNPLHTYLVGNFTVTLTVTGPAGSDTVSVDSAVEVGAEPPTALSTMPVPLPDDLGSFVADIDRAVQLGKALFWDVQLGSDGLTACASCHYHAGVDNRPRNTLHPGADGAFGAMNSGAGGGPNYQLRSGDFPFTKFLDPQDGLVMIANVDDRRGATGVFRTSFTGVDPALEVDQGVDQDDPLFQVGGIDTLQTTGRDAPTTIGSIFFHRIFHDGRANHFFNGRNIWGNADPSRPPVLEKRADGSLGEISILLNNAATASQAVGPPLSDVEMSWGGRTWADVGRKMVARRPLAGQFVDPTDSVLGPLANPSGPGLRPTLRYANMIRQAFRDRWWGSSQRTADGHTQMEANFALFFGLAIECYEATLIPDRAPFDLFRMGDRSALTLQQQHGMALFLGRGRCITCHDSPLFAGSLRGEVLHMNPEEPEGLIERMTIQNALTTAALTFSTSPASGELPLTFNPFRRPVALYTFDRRLLASVRLPAGQRCPPAGEAVYPLVPSSLMPSIAHFRGSVRISADGQCGYRIVVSVEWGELGPPGDIYSLLIGGQVFPLLVPPPTRQAAYDNGFYNIGVRPETEDPGVGGNGPFGPLSITRRVQRGEDVGQDTHSGPVGPNERVAVDGAFKTPTLRNVELTGPYMHNGGMATLEQVVEFYSRAGDFGDVNFRNKDIDVFGFDITEQEKADLVAFLKSLTDPRVRLEQAPFDHPELPLKTGHLGDHLAVVGDGTGNAVLDIDIRPATGAAGGPPIPTFEERLPASITVALVSQGSGGATFGLICDKRPRAEVTVSLELSRAGLATISPARVSFTPENWRIAQMVRVATLDPAASGGQKLRVITSVQSTDQGFAGLELDDLELDFESGSARGDQDHAAPQDQAHDPSSEQLDSTVVRR